MTSRIEVINYLIKRHNYKTYLEIGCEDNLCFDNINISHKTGVDPKSGGTVRTTSDEFFNTNQTFYDIIFVDGLHHSDQVLRDIDNSLKFLNPGGSIVVHDINPPTEDLQVVPRNQDQWYGDCWKAWVELRQTRQDLRMFTLDMETGIGIIKTGRQDLLTITEEINFYNFNLNRQSWLNLIDLQQFYYLIIPTIYCFYEPVSVYPAHSELQRIDLWKKSWSARGWTPVVLNLTTAKHNTIYHQFVSVMTKFPTINHKEYMLRCFTRWLAFLQVGGGFISDYDCINYSHYPPNNQDFSNFISHESFVPCYVVSGVPGIEKLINLFLDSINHIEEYRQDPFMQINGKLEMSDMTILSHHQKDFTLKQYVISYLNAGWETAPLVHYHHGVAPQETRVQTIYSARPI